MPNEPALSRRTFCRRTAAFVGAADLLFSPLHPRSILGAENGPLRAAIIGHSGRGDYGHGLDVIFNGVPGVEVVAIADPVTGGRQAAAKRCGALRQYADYRELLPKEKPQLVSIAPRWSDQHHEMGMAALEAGAHLYMEKPITRTLAEADQLLELAERKGLKIAVAHQMRLAPSIAHLKHRMAEGLIGDVLQLRSWGKQDDRAGGEDMLVLGTHLFDMMRHLVGDPTWCTARILQDGREATRDDARAVKEQIGQVAGTDIEAQFSFTNGVLATFTSRSPLRQTVGHWGIEVIGSAATVRILMDVCPQVFIVRPGKWTATGKTDAWVPLSDDPTLHYTGEQRGFGPGNRRVVDDWLEAIRAHREPICSGRNAMRALEMVMAVYQAGLTGRRVTLPLTNRGQPLDR